MNTRGQAASSAAEVADPVGQGAGIDLVQPDPTPLEPLRERAEVGAVRALRRLGEASVLEKAVDRLVHAHAVRCSARCAHQPAADYASFARNDLENRVPSTVNATEPENVFPRAVAGGR